MVQEFKPLTGLRFLACLFVFAVHLPAWAMPQNATFEAIAAIVIGQANIVMPFFFMLSGFVLIHVYGARVADAGSDIQPPRLNRAGLADFLARRVARLFPPHLLCLALILPLSFWAGAVEPGPLLAHLTLTQTLVPDIAYYGAFNTPSWAMSTEFIFSLCFAPMLLILLPLGERARLALLALCLIAPLLAAAALSAAGMSGSFLLYINPFARLAEFAAGALLYLLWQRYRWKLPGLHWELLAFAACAAIMIFTIDLPPAFRYWPIFMPATLFLIAVFAEGSGKLSRFFASDTMRFLGRVSFAFYLVHFVVISYAGLTPLSAIAETSPWRWSIIPLLLLTTFLCALPIHYGFERKIEPRVRAALLRLWQKRLKSAPPATS